MTKIWFGCIMYMVVNDAPKRKTEVPTMSHVKVESVGPAIGTRRRLMTVELPRKWWQWMIASLLFVVVLFALMFPMGKLSEGRIGFVGVEGNSMHNVFPQGSWVFALPIRPEEGDYVVAFVPVGSDDARDKNDRNPSLVVKKQGKDSLVSIDDPSHYSIFESRGVIIFHLPPAPWERSKAASSPAPKAMLSSEKEKRQADEAKVKQAEIFSGFLQATDVVPANQLVIEGDNGDFSQVLKGGSWIKPMDNEENYRLKITVKGEAAKGVGFVLQHTGPVEVRVNGEKIDVFGLEPEADGRTWVFKEIEEIEVVLPKGGMQASFGNLKIRR